MTRRNVARLIQCFMAYGWQGEKVRLVPLDPERHFENCLRWVNDPEITEHLGLSELPMTRLAEKEWFDQACLLKDSEILFAIETLDGRHIGTSGIHRISHFHKTALTGTMIGEKDVWGQGYGTEASRMRARYCFEVLGLQLLMSEYMVGNVGSQKMQAKVGYVEVGVIPSKYWKRGRYVDSMQTYLTKEAFEKALGRE